jgi:hypothetical protein
MRFVSHRKHSYGSLRPVRRLTLLFFCRRYSYLTGNKSTNLQGLLRRYLYFLKCYLILKCHESIIKRLRDSNSIKTNIKVKLLCLRYLQFHSCAVSHVHKACRNGSGFYKIFRDWVWVSVGVCGATCCWENLLLGARPVRAHPHSHGPIDSRFVLLLRINLLLGLTMDGNPNRSVNIFIYTFIIHMIY